MMFRPTLLLTLSASLLAAPASGAGPYGHYVLARRAITAIRSGGPAPAELIEALGDGECQRAFAGGAVAPDLVEAASHNGNTSELARQMLARARSRVQTARAVNDQPALQQARLELSFAYGWLAHCGADLNIHPKVNEFAGDAYRYNNKGQKARHAAQEAQLTAYLQKAFLRPEERAFDIKIPYPFLAESLGIEEARLRQATGVIKGKVMGELSSAGKVHLSEAQLAAIWRTHVRAAHADTLAFIQDPRRFERWDLDCGRISTEEFDELRRLVLELNGGTLPPAWGGRYLEWHGVLRGLGREARRARLLALLGKAAPRATPPSFTEPRAPLSPQPGALAELHRTKYIGLSIARPAKFWNGRYHSYWHTLEVPRRHELPTTASPLVWADRSFSQNASVQALERITLAVRGHISADGTRIDRLSMTFARGSELTIEIELKDLPLNPRPVGVIREGDVQFAVWDAVQARAHLVKASIRSQGNTLQEIQWTGAADHRIPPIWVKLSKYAW